MDSYTVTIVKTRPEGTGPAADSAYYIKAATLEEAQEWTKDYFARMTTLALQPE